MQILGTDAYRIALNEAISSSQKSVSLISAYITIEGINWILEKLPHQSSCRVITRWNCSDLVSGASDIEVFEKLKDRNHKLYILPDLHAKVISIDRKKLFLGSANITNSGLKLVPGGNREIGTILIPDDEDLGVIETLFSEAILINQDIYDDFYTELQRLKVSNPKLPRPKWSSGLFNKIRKPPKRIWVTETLWCDSPEDLLNQSDDLSPEALHDLVLLGLDFQDEINEKDLRQAFLESRILLWLKNKLQSTPNREIYFGQLSSELHNSFLDDPKPYRKDVKSLLQNLLNWCQSLCGSSIVIDRPNHSQRIRFTEN